MKKVYISVDCGFDKFKIAINERCVSFSSKMVDVTETLTATNAGIAAENTYIKYDDRIYEFGDSIDYALSLRNNLQKYKEYLDTFRNLSRFHTEPFRISLLAAIGYAIFGYDSSVKPKDQIIPNIDDIEFAIGIALPHESLGEWEDLKVFLSKEHEFDLLIGATLTKIPFSLDFKKAKYCCNSQVIAAFLYQATDDKNMMISRKETLPCAIIDAGYKTLGCFEIAENLAINNARSNTTHAMLNIDQIVAEKVRAQGKLDFDYLQVQRHARGDGHGSVRANDKVINVKEIYETVLKDQCEKLLEFLEKEYSLDDLLTFIITGGTGMAYIDQIKEYMEKNHKGLQVIITDKPYRGTDNINPIYAIVLGLHKQLQDMYK